MTLIISSIMYSTKFLVIISLSYMFFQVVVTLLEIINEDKKSRPHIKSIRILKSVSHYVYPILSIIFSVLYLENINVLTIFIIISSLTLVTWLRMDIYSELMPKTCT